MTSIDMNRSKRTLKVCITSSLLLSLSACNANLVSPINNNAIQLNPNINVHLEGARSSLEKEADSLDKSETDKTVTENYKHEVKIKVELPANNRHDNFEYIRVRVVKKNGQVVAEKKLVSQNEEATFKLPDDKAGFVFFAEAINAKRLRVLEVTDSGVEILQGKNNLTLHLNAIDIRLAIFPFVNLKQTQDDDYIGTLLSETIMTELASKITVVERQSIEAILSEQKLQKSELIDLSTAISVGKLLGANYILMASFQKGTSEIAVYLKVIDVETGVIDGSKSQKIISGVDDYTKTATLIIESFLGNKNAPN